MGYVLLTVALLVIVGLITYGIKERSCLIFGHEKWEDFLFQIYFIYFRPMKKEDPTTQ